MQKEDAMQATRIPILGTMILMPAMFAYGQSSPVGRWRTPDDKSGQPASIVTIWEEDGQLTGKIERVFDPYPKESNPKCTACKDVLKDKPIVGMKILWGLTLHDAEWSGGRILDPDSGQTYNCTLTLDSGGGRLKVRGFVRFAVLGRTQYWQRE
jgi:uncharacterized protein (DUF2147 family)